MFTSLHFLFECSGNLCLSGVPRSAGNGPGNTPHCQYYRWQSLALPGCPAQQVGQHPPPIRTSAQVVYIAILPKSVYYGFEIGAYDILENFCNKSHGRASLRRGVIKAHRSPSECLNFFIEYFTYKIPTQPTNYNLLCSAPLKHVFSHSNYSILPYSLSFSSVLLYSILFHPIM